MQWHDGRPGAQFYASTHATLTTHEGEPRFEQQQRRRSASLTLRPQPTLSDSDRERERLRRLGARLAARLARLAGRSRAAPCQALAC